MSDTQLSIVAKLQTKEFVSGIKKMSRSLDRMGSKAKAVGSNLTRSLSLPIAALGTAAVKAAADMEALETSLVSLTGGTEQAAAAMEKLNDFTAKTPFQLEGVATAFRQLVASGSSVDEATEQLQFLGDIAATSGSSIEEIAAIFAKVNAKGKVELENLNQLGDRGIQIFGALSEATGLLPSELGAGAVSVEQFNETLKSFAEQGGFASGAMERLSQTAAGKFSTALDNVKLALANIGKDLLPLVTEALDFVTGLAQKFQALDSEAKKNILTTAALVAGIGPLIFAFGSLVTMAGNVVGAVGNINKALDAFKVTATISLGPIVAIAAAIGGIVTLALIDRARRLKKEIDGIREDTANADKAADWLGLEEADKPLLQTQQRIDAIKKKLDQFDVDDSRIPVQQFFDDLFGADESLARDTFDELYKTLADDLGRRPSIAELIAEVDKRKGAADIAVSDRIAERFQQKQAAADKAVQDQADAAAREREESSAKIVDAVEAEIKAYQEEQDRLKELGYEYDDKETQGKKIQEMLLDQVTEVDNATAAWGRYLTLLEENDAARLAARPANMTPMTPRQAGEVPNTAPNGNGTVFASWADIQGIDYSLTEQVEEITAVDAAVQALSSSMQALAGTFRDIFVGIADGSKTAAQGILEFVTQTISSMLAAASAAVIAKSFIEGSIAAAPILAAVGLAALGGLFAAIPAFAEGGAVLGPTLALVGEKPGSRGEAIIPFEKIGDFVKQVGGDTASGPVEVFGRISGEDIVLSSRRANGARGRSFNS